ncbi:Baseplate J family protein [Fulvimarina endophytica]|uniref:Baseplate J family protein n=1 Tax=Fulvimarina endophytica TaxID=2293836 RepID=A0A371X2Y2_9HYPH|nr:baseplate J/gp47 family protein [Fulvimarina endophytica]RFC63595.1 Baseplate J family protein [Fulvimarina endophytica]
MAWPIPSARTIAERIATRLESAIATARGKAGLAVDALALSRAVRSEKGNLAHITRAIAPEVRATHDHLAWWGRQYFPDTAEEEFVVRHGDIHGILPRPATRAIGRVDIEGVAGTALPAGLELASSDGTLYATTEAAAIGANGSVSIRVAASATGPGGNLEAGIRLATVLPRPDVSRITVDPDGLAGGASEADWRELQAAVIAHLRQRPHGGAGFDYPTWLAAAFPVRAVKVYPDWIGRGSVGVAVVMEDDAQGRAPTEAELEAQLIYLGRPNTAEGVRPVTAHVVTLAAEPRTISPRIRLRPDTIATRAAVEEAWQRFVATIGDAEDEGNVSPIGAIIEPSRISEAISAANGEYGHDLLSPSLRVALDRLEFPVAGEIDFAEAVL